MNSSTGEMITVGGIPHYCEWVKNKDNQVPKPVMVFVHGWGGSLRYWRSTAVALCHRFDCLLYDLPGFGRSPIPEGFNYDLANYATDLQQLLDTLKLERVYIHSHSMGASIATIFASSYPERVVKLILTCNGIFTYDRLAFAAFYFFGNYVVKLRYQWFKKIPGLDRLFMARFLHRPLAKSDRFAFLEDFLVADEKAALGTIYSSVSKEAVETMPRQFRELQIPTLLIAGAKDRIIPPNLGRQAAVLNSLITYVEIPETAHFPMLEDPSTYLGIVNKFLEG